MKEVLQAIGPGGLILAVTVAACVGIAAAFKILDLALGLAGRWKVRATAKKARHKETRRWLAMAARLNGVQAPRTK